MDPLLRLSSAGRAVFVGTGVQARSHLEAIACVRRLSDVRVWSPTESHRAAFVRDMRHLAMDLRAAVSVPEAVDGADVIVVATAAVTPVLKSAWVRDGAHICAVGACRPSHRELDGALVARCRLFVDSKIGALAEAGDIILAIQEGAITSAAIVGELGELLTGAVPGRQDATQVTVFKSLGMAVEDVAAAHLAYTRAIERRIGTRLAM